MAGYNGHRGPNVSEFIANLNTIPSAQDVTGQGPENFNLDDELAMFTNTQFFDFDLGQDADLKPPNFDFDFNAQESAAPAAAEDVNGLDFNQGEYAFPDFSGFPSTTGFPAVPPQIQTSQPLYAPSSIGSPQSGLVSPQNGEKRSADAVADGRYAPTFEDASRLAAEEDKRRRNTAASARFRVKKKQREQALEKSAKEMSDKVAALEGRINQLETENKWLKNLIMEKNGNKDDITVLWKKYSQEVAERRASEERDGVGTAKA